MSAEGKKGKKRFQRRYHVMILKERNCKQAAWLRTDGMTASQMEEAVGVFVLQALSRFRLKCFAEGTVPDIQLLPIVMTEDAYNELEMDTWRCEMEELRKDVERGTES